MDYLHSTNSDPGSIDLLSAEIWIFFSGRRVYCQRSSVEETESKPYMDPGQQCSSPYPHTRICTDSLAQDKAPKTVVVLWLAQRFAQCMGVDRAWPCWTCWKMGSSGWQLTHSPQAGSSEGLGQTLVSTAIVYWSQGTFHSCWCNSEWLEPTLLDQLEGLTGTS